MQLTGALDWCFKDDAAQDGEGQKAPDMSNGAPDAQVSNSRQPLANVDTSDMFISSTGSLCNFQCLLSSGRLHIHAQCLVRFVYLLIIRCLCTKCLYSEGLVVLRDHTNYIYGVVTTVY